MSKNNFRKYSTKKIYIFSVISEVIKSLMNKIFYTISIKKCLWENFIKKKLRTCTSEGKNGKRKQCTIYDERV